jgi:hypothetical protein
MNSKAILVAAAMMAVGFVGVMSTASAASLACVPNGTSIPDQSNPHFFNAFSSAGVGTSQGQTGGGVTVVFSTNNPPCDQVGSDGDNEQGLSGAQMPITGAGGAGIGGGCPYSQDVANEQAGGGPITIGHHFDDIYVTNGGIDVTWTSGVDGQDPAATLAGQTCTGNGVISDDATTDPADCSDSTGANINILGSVHQDTDPQSIGTNDPLSGFTCLDAVDGNEWTFLNVGPFVGTTAGEGAILGVELTPTAGDQEQLINVDAGGAACVDTSDGPSDADTTTSCILTVDTDWTAPGVTGQVGFSLPITGTIASGVEI